MVESSPVFCQVIINRFERSSNEKQESLINYGDVFEINGHF